MNIVDVNLIQIALPTKLKLPDSLLQENPWKGYFMYWKYLGNKLLPRPSFSQLDDVKVIVSINLVILIIDIGNKLGSYGNG